MCCCRGYNLAEHGLWVYLKKSSVEWVWTIYVFSVVAWANLSIEQHAIVRNSITLIHTKQTVTAHVIIRSVPYLFRDVFMTENVKKDHANIVGYTRRNSEITRIIETRWRSYKSNNCHNPARGLSVTFKRAPPRSAYNNNRNINIQW